MADYDFEGKDEPTVLGSYNSYKGKRTTAARKLELLLDLQSKDYSAITSASINDCLKSCERIVEILAAQANWLLANKHAKAKDFIDKTTAWVEEVRTYADLSIQVHHKHNVGAIAPGAKPPSAGAVTKPDQELRPAKLQKDISMGELRDWQEQFQSYYNSSNLRQMTYLQQQGYLLSNLDTDICRHLRRVITATTPIFPTPGSVSCFTLLTQYFAQRNPVHVRRQAFFRASQKEGQSVLDFRAQLRQRGNEGESHPGGLLLPHVSARCKRQSPSQGAVQSAKAQSGRIRCHLGGACPYGGLRKAPCQDSPGESRLWASEEVIILLLLQLSAHQDHGGGEEKEEGHPGQVLPVCLGGPYDPRMQSSSHSDVQTLQHAGPHFTSVFEIFICQGVSSRLAS